MGWDVNRILSEGGEMGPLRLFQGVSASSKQEYKQKASNKCCKMMQEATFIIIYMKNDWTNGDF